VLLRALPGFTPAFVVLGLILALLVPLPTVLVDLLLSTSLAAAVLLLVGSLTVRRTSDFLGFPQLLLLTTFGRLVLNVSTTRLILTQADAGRVVDAFASVVVREDLLVGAVVFAIITLVQYVVIARGAERVAEVGARFALDALPGHQAAIEADARAGVAGSREAARRRAELLERSRFHGAMDGAMKLVKNDSIAGLVITAVNLLGGIAVGGLRFGMDLPTSLDRFGRLTIGDGLLSQIPAVLILLAASVLVARVDREEASGSASPLSWLDPTMLLVPAALLAMMAAVPRMPALAFLATAAGLAALALSGAARQAVRQRDGVPTHVRSLRVELPGRGTQQRRLVEALHEARRQCAAQLGISLPPLEVTGASDGLLRVSFAGQSLLRRQATGVSDDDLVVEVYRAIVASAEAFVDLDWLDARLVEVRARAPAVVVEAATRLGAPELLEVVRGFLRERVRLPTMEAILAAVAEEPLLRESSERWRALELVRVRLARWFVADLVAGPAGDPAAPFVRLEPDAEAWLASRTHNGVAGVTLRATARERQQFLAGVREALHREEAHAGPTAQAAPVVLVTSPSARGAAALLLRDASPRGTVVSTAELEYAGIALPTEPVWVASP
jgi:type III secretion protein V